MVRNIRWFFSSLALRLAIGIALLSGGGFSSALAQDATPTPAASPTAVPKPTPLFGIYPKETGPRTFFDVTQDAGTTKTYTVVMVNAGTEDNGTFVGRTFVVDGKTKVNGGLDTGGPNEEKTGATTWFDYPNDIVELEPGTGIERSFEVTVPKDTPTGQYVVAMCFETAEPLEIEGVANLKQNLRQTIAFYLTVPGEIHAEFSIDQMRIQSDQTWSGLEALIVNTGNILVRPEGRLTLSAADGSPLASTEVAFGAYYAGQSGLLQVGLGGILPIGDYLVTLELRDPASGATAIVQNQTVSVTADGGFVAEDAVPVSFLSATGEIVPDLANPQFLSIDAVIGNTGEALEDAELSLNVLKDGNLVENYVVVSPLSLPPGETTVSSRYIPIDGWSAGTWTFTLSVQRLDRETGVSTVLSTTALGDPIVITGG